MIIDRSDLDHAISALAVPRMLVEHRAIASGDEYALLPDELSIFANSVTKVQRASGAVRIVARRLLRQLGQPEWAITKSASGVPNWPAGIVGSLAHDAEIAVAAVGLRREYSGVGVDVEPAKPLDHDLLGLVATKSECAEIKDDLLLARVLFTIKEAVYKAAYPIDGIFLDHHDVEVKLAEATATTSNGRTVPFRYCVATHIVALAFVPALVGHGQRIC
jgi:4'-phosphopantetheinyl transferase EntD